MKKKIDLHVHSSSSERPSEWFLQKIGAKESYTNPETLYQLAKNKGMDFVTITDHNKIDGALALKEKHAEDVIVGMEATTYFPDGCKIHILLYDIEPKHYEAIQLLREDIFDLRDYIAYHNLAYSVAHATFSINNKLTCDHLEQLILLFDVFEGINGARTSLFNTNWMEILGQLTPEHIEKLYARHHIEPISEDPWLKGFTAGSDDHAGIFIGHTYSMCEAQNAQDVVNAIREKRIRPMGRHNNHKTLAFALYKIAYDYARQLQMAYPDSPLSLLAEILLKKQTRKVLSKKQRVGNASASRMGVIMGEITGKIGNLNMTDIENGLDGVFEKISDLTDEFVRKNLEALLKDVMAGDMPGLFMNLLAFTPGMFFSAPFLTTLRVLYRNRAILNEIKSRLDIQPDEKARKVLWFTDTISDLNGVSETIKDMGRHAHEHGAPLRIVVAAPEAELGTAIAPGTMYLPTCFSCPLPLYDVYTLHFPSVLKSLDIIHKEQPTEIIVSTPGPVGLMGLLAAKLLGIACRGYYHTDFTMQLERMAPDMAITQYAERANRWVYSLMDEIMVPSPEYIETLAQRGFERAKLKLVYKGIDVELFAPDARKDGMKVSRDAGGVNLIYAGRISKDKNVDLLLDIQRGLRKRHAGVKLIIAGNGPYFDEFSNKAREVPGVSLLGRVCRSNLPAVFAQADIFVFPSTTDTFGLSVMEAQACGLPAVVSDLGGPQGIILNGATGCVAKHDDIKEWVSRIEDLIELKLRDPAAFARMRGRASERIHQNFSLEKAFLSIMLETGGAPAADPQTGTEMVFNIAC